jgi:hypothetical protein
MRITQIWNDGWDSSDHIAFLLLASDLKLSSEERDYAINYALSLGMSGDDRPWSAEQERLLLRVDSFVYLGHLN